MFSRQTDEQICVLSGKSIPAVAADGDRPLVDRLRCERTGKVYLALCAELEQRPALSAEEAQRTSEGTYRVCSGDGCVPTVYERVN